MSTCLTSSFKGSGPCFIRNRRCSASVTTTALRPGLCSALNAHRSKPALRARHSKTQCSSAAGTMNLPASDGGEHSVAHLMLSETKSPAELQFPYWARLWQLSNKPAYVGSIPFNPAPEGSAFLASIKGFLFYAFTLVLSVPLFISMLLMTPFVLLLDKYRYQV